MNYFKLFVLSYLGTSTSPETIKEASSLLDHCMKETKSKISRNYIQEKLNKDTDPSERDNHKINKDSENLTNIDILSILCDDKEQRKKWVNLGIYGNIISY